jgi:hypothetical protein
VKSQRERDAEKREQKLREIAEAVESGGLVIRKMTPKERKELPKRPPREKRR